jgi:hypothetical protein
MKFSIYATGVEIMGEVEIDTPYDDPDAENLAIDAFWEKVDEAIESVGFGIWDKHIETYADKID